MHRLTFKQTVEFNVSIDLNDELAERLSLNTDAINQFLQDRRGQIVEAAKTAGGRKIVELLQAYTEEFVVPTPRAEDILTPAELASAKDRWDRQDFDLPKTDADSDEPKAVEADTNKGTNK